MIFETVRVLKTFRTILANKNVVTIWEINPVPIASDSRLLIRSDRLGAVQFFAGVGNIVGISDKTAAAKALVSFFALKNKLSIFFQKFTKNKRFSCIKLINKNFAQLLQIIYKNCLQNLFAKFVYKNCLQKLFVIFCFFILFVTYYL